MGGRKNINYSLYIGNEGRNGNIITGKQDRYFYILVSFIIFLSAGILLFYPEYLKPELIITFFLLLVFLWIFSAGRTGKANHELNEALSEDEYETCIYMVEEERKRIARDLHDGVQQKLAGIAMILNARLEKDDPGVNQAVDLLSESINDIRNISHSMNLEEIEANDLCAVMKKTTKTLSKQTGIDIKLECSGYSQMPVWHKINLFRITQELLTNTIKHSKATAITIQLKKKNSSYLFFYKDNGKGCPAHYKQGMGIKNIKDRVTTMKGDLHIDAGHGFQMKIQIPG